MDAEAEACRPTGQVDEQCATATADCTASHTAFKMRASILYYCAGCAAHCITHMAEASWQPARHTASIDQRGQPGLLQDDGTLAKRAHVMKPEGRVK